MRFLCCDLGGTQADWGVFDSAENKFVHTKGLPTSPYDDFYIMMDEYLKLYDAHSDTSDQVFRRHMISHSGVSDHPEMTPSGAVW